MNPRPRCSRRVAALEGGVGALAFASGQAACTVGRPQHRRRRDEVVTPPPTSTEGPSSSSTTRCQLGVHNAFVDADDPKTFRRAITPHQALYAETIGNPMLDMLDLEAIADIAHAAGMPLMVDNTCHAVPLRPLEHGADSSPLADKYIGGHGTSIGGILVDGGGSTGRRGKFPMLTEPDPSYHGFAYTRLRPRRLHRQAPGQLLRDMGGCLPP